VLHEDETFVKLRIEVIDTGIGISKEKLETVFEMFRQEDLSTTRNYGGSGLGLYLCRQMVSLMGGQISVLSEKGKGSTFWIELKFAKALAMPPENMHESVLRYTPTGWMSDMIKQSQQELVHQGSVSKMSVLLVEDNTLNQKVGKRLLNRLGANVDLANNGKEAVDLVIKRYQTQEKMWDVVLMDKQMPFCDGIAATQLIRQYERDHVYTNPDAPPRGAVIVALTAECGSEVVERCKATGMDDFLAKPLSLYSLKKLLLKYGVGCT